MAERSFQKWQGRAIQQKHNTSRLLLGLSGAALGFSVSLLGKETSYLGFLQSVAFQTHVFAQLISIGAGVAFSINRVRDFDPYRDILSPVHANHAIRPENSRWTD